MVTAQERIILRKAAEIRRAKNRETRLKIAAARKPGGKANRGRVRDTAFLAFLRRQPCVCGCGRPAPSDAAHIRMASPERGKLPTGMQVKPSDRFAVPLCRPCHERQHSGSEARFWSELGLDPFEIAEAHFSTYKNDPADGAGR
jgi:hypothetical protein